MLRWHVTSGVQFDDLSWDYCIRDPGTQCRRVPQGSQTQIAEVACSDWGDQEQGASEDGRAALARGKAEQGHLMSCSW